MRIDVFQKKIIDLIKRTSAETLPFSSKIFEDLINKIANDNELSIVLKMSWLTIIFEAAYKLINDSPILKNEFSELRIERWTNHYGTPTINFLMTYSREIDDIQSLLQKTENEVHVSDLPQICNKLNLSVDSLNLTLVDQSSTKSFAMVVDERPGEFYTTNNPIGGFGTAPCDPVSQKFIEFSTTVSESDGTILEIGAAFGGASIEAIKKGARVFCNDIDVKNLAVVSNRYQNSTNANSSITGDFEKLTFIPGSFPEELIDLPKNYFDAILVSRVLHFFKGEMIEKSLNLFASLLKPNGKLFIVCETPYLKNWSLFIPEYEKRKLQNIKWPGEITNPAVYESSGRVAFLPSFVHWITKDVLERALIDAKFSIEYISYINRKNQFPPDLLLDGRESVGAICTPSNKMVV